MLQQFKTTKVNRYWNRDIKGKGVTVAVLDSGVHDHKDFKGRLHEQYDLLTDKVLPVADYDIYGHGTHVAGLIAGSVTGIAPEADILPISVYDDHRCIIEDMSNAIDYIISWRHPVTNRPVDIVNMSFTNFYKINWDILMDKLKQNGITCVCSIGNYDKQIPPITDQLLKNDYVDSRKYDIEVARYPAYLHYPIVVGAVDVYGCLTSYTSSLRQVDTCQLGMDVISCCNNPRKGLYSSKSGTSMSTAIVSGMLALYKCENNNRTDEDLYNLLVNNYDSKYIVDNKQYIVSTMKLRG